MGELMKLVFPNGEHEQVELSPGLNFIGSGSDCDVVLAEHGIAERHAMITVSREGAMIGVDDATNITRVNGQLVAARTMLKAGDALLFASVQCQVTGRTAAGAPPPPISTKETDESNEGSTQVRMAIPKFVLRGVSGSTFGTNFPLYGTTLIGRHSECEICLPADEVSRKHAKLQVTVDGLFVEDLGSANGSFVNGKRVRQSKLEPGDELKLDTVRFLVQAPGMDTSKEDAPTLERPVAIEDESGSSSVKWVVIVTILIGLTVAGLKFGGII
jgi:pSer/pThr/pTyr-binding forkhead associated (FHA) protein